MFGNLDALHAARVLSVVSRMGDWVILLFANVFNQLYPYGADGSTDSVQNGLCLSPTYHRAYDRGLIFLGENRRMLINRQKRDDLVRLGLGGGLAEFESHLGREIFLPADRTQWPDPAMIRQANSFRTS